MLQLLFFCFPVSPGWPRMEALLNMWEMCETMYVNVYNVN